jgi:hypothetical protein
MRIGNGQKNYPDGLKDTNPDDLTVRSFICGQVIRFFIAAITASWCVSL